MPLTLECACRKLRLQRGAHRACALWDGREVSVPPGDMKLQDYNGEDLTELCE